MCRPYFALTERIPESQALFEWSMGMAFRQDWSFSAKSRTEAFIEQLPSRVLDAVVHANRWDVDLCVTVLCAALDLRPP